MTVHQGRLPRRRAELPSGMFSATYTVAGKESVTVPAGKFEAWRVLVKDKLNPEAAAWLAPGAGIVKTSDFDRPSRRAHRDRDAEVASLAFVCPVTVSAVVLLALAAACGDSSSGVPGLDASADGGGADAGGFDAADAADATPTPLPSPKSLVWIGAHPDDEMYAAPWLGALCLEQKASCKLLVLTRGEKGNCKLPGGCSPDVGTVRDAELVASAKLFGAELVHWDLGDSVAGSPAGVAGAWADKMGGEEQLLQSIRDVVGGAERIVTFDPRHGDSCHHDHRAAGALAIVVARSMADAGPAPGVTLVASKQILSPAAADPAIVAFDASQVLAATGQPAWSTLVQVLETHASQFTPDEVAAVSAVPAAKRKTYLLDLEDAVPNDPLYQGLCP